MNREFKSYLFEIIEIVCKMPCSLSHKLFLLGPLQYCLGVTMNRTLIIECIHKNTFSKLCSFLTMIHYGFAPIW